MATQTELAQIVGHREISEAVGLLRRVIESQGDFFLNPAAGERMAHAMGWRVRDLMDRGNVDGAWRTPRFRDDPTYTVFRHPLHSGDVIVVYRGQHPRRDGVPGYRTHVAHLGESLYDDSRGDIEDAADWIQFPEIMAQAEAQRREEAYGEPLSWPPTLAEVQARAEEYGYLIAEFAASGDNSEVVYCGHCGQFVTGWMIADDRGTCPNDGEDDRFLRVTPTADGSGGHPPATYRTGDA